MGWAAGVERWTARKVRGLGLRPEFPFARLQAWADSTPDVRVVERRKIMPLGVYTLVSFERAGGAAQ